MPNHERRQWIEERTAVLEGSTSPEDLEAAATELAASDDPEALDALGRFLPRSEFLDRLDEPGSEDRMLHLRGVLSPLIERPSPEVASLCLSLADDPIYLENDRKSFLLRALSAVVPMSAETVEVFRRTNEQGYFAFNALLLADNGSQLALDLFVSMMSDRTEAWEDRVEILHTAILPNRTRLAILKMVANLTTKDLENPVATAAIESVFDYQVVWFKIHGPTPPGWRTASDDVLHYVIDLGERSKRRPNLPASTIGAIEETTEIANALLKRRGA